MKRYLFILILYLLLTITFAGLDANYVNSGGSGTIVGPHIVSWLIRAAFAIFFVILSYSKLDVPYPDGLYDLLIYASSSWIVFDLTWNIIREGVNLVYVGCTAFTDLPFCLLGDWAWPVQTAFKLGLLTFAIVKRYEPNRKTH